MNKKIKKAFENLYEYLSIHCPDAVADVELIEKELKKTEKKIVCEICKKEIIGEPIYFEDGWLIHPEDENPECMKEAMRQDAKMSPSK